MGAAAHDAGMAVRSPEDTGKIGGGLGNLDEAAFCADTSRRKD
jgi:hypothetical protein